MDTDPFRDTLYRPFGDRSSAIGVFPDPHAVDVRTMHTVTTTKQAEYVPIYITGRHAVETIWLVSVLADSTSKQRRCCSEIAALEYMRFRFVARRRR